MDWSDFLSALALLLIFEGLYPFASPEGWKKMIVQISNMNAQTLRIMGLVMITLGIIILYLVRN